MSDIFIKRKNGYGMTKVNHIFDQIITLEISIDENDRIIGLDIEGISEQKFEIEDGTIIREKK